MEQVKLKKRVILVDADYVDTIAGDMARYFSSQIGREVGKADLPGWLTCCALDCGMQAEQADVQVIFVHSAKKTGFENFQPSSFSGEIDGRAFMEDAVGEFLLSTVADEQVNVGSPLIEQCIKAVASDEAVQVLAVVAADSTRRNALRDVSTKESPRVVWKVSMEQPPLEEQQNYIPMGFGLLHSLGIKPEELD